MPLRVEQEGGQVDPQLVLQTPQQTAAGSHRRFAAAPACWEPSVLTGSVPVGAVHQAGQTQLTLPRQRAQIVVALEEVEQLGGVGHPKGLSAGGGLLALKADTESAVKDSTRLHLLAVLRPLAWTTSCIKATILPAIRVTL